MPQTLLALFALTLSSFLVLNQKQMTMRSRTNMVSDEAQLAASGLASDIMEMVAARSFDENSTPAAIHFRQDVPSSPSLFSSPGHMGRRDRGDEGCNLLRPALTPECDDVDDVAGLGWLPVDIELAHGRTLPFEANLDVYFVDSPSSMERSGTKTRHKRVVLDLRSRFLPGTMGPDGNPVTATRVVSFDPIKAELDFERIHGPIGTVEPGSGGWTPIPDDDEDDRSTN